MISLKNILVPTDFSEHSSKALRYGTELAAKFGAKLHLLHAVEATPIIYEEGAVYFPPEVAAELVAAATQHLNELEIHGANDVTVVREVVSGHPFVGIVDYAKRCEIDLIVMGTHGLGAVAQMLIGSVAEKVVRKAPCPVLVVRDDEHDFVLP